MAKSLEESLNSLKSTMAAPATMSLRSVAVEEPVTMASVPYAEENWRPDSSTGKYNHYDDTYVYYDETYSTVDEFKKVTISEKQVNLTQEANSQVIPFVMNKYWDGIDLELMAIRINFVNSEGLGAQSIPYNVQYSDTKVRFDWLVPPEATSVAGKLKMEIIAVGTTVGGIEYKLRTRPNDDINVLESLQGNGVIEPSQGWDYYIEEVNKYVVMAQNASSAANISAKSAQDALAGVDDKINAISEEITTQVTENVQQNLDDNYYTKTEVDEQIQAEGLSRFNSEYDEETGTLTFYNGEEEMTSHEIGVTEAWKSNFKSEILLETTTNDGLLKDDIMAEVEQKIDEIDMTQELDQLKTEIADGYYNKEEIGANHYTKTEMDTKLKNISLDGYATETFVTEKIGIVDGKADTNKESIDSLSKVVTNLQTTLDGMDKSPNTYYKTTYNEPYIAADGTEKTGENTLVLYESTNKEDEKSWTVVATHVISGGSGGSASVLKISYVTTSPVITTINDKVLITYNFSGTDSSNDPISEGKYIWKIGTKIIASGIATAGENTFDATDFASTTSQKFTLTIMDDDGNSVSKSWTVQQVDVRIDSTFNDTIAYNIGEVSFNYIPYGAIEKVVHFVLDGKEIGTVTTATSGIPMSYTLPSQTHGSHLLDVFMTTTINNTEITSNHIYKDIVWKDPASVTPIIGCATPDIKATQYNTVNIKYTVVDPRTETPEVTWYVNDEVVSTETLTEKGTDGYYVFSYKANNFGTFTFKVTCGDAEPKLITLEVEKLNINVSPVTAGLAFDFNPVGYSNSSADRLWSNNDVTMTVSDNFDWVNGGYQIDEAGDQYFCVKAGTTAVINYNLFADDPKLNGKEFKAIFRTKNIRKRNTSFLTCMNENVGLDMKVENATIYNSGGSLRSDYCEDTIIEYEFNINKKADMMVVMSYEDGTPGKPCEYTETSSFKQTTPQPITIGSPDCDIHIYRLKVYSISLSDTDIKNNFIADARNADEMLKRYNRNQIYNENSGIVSTSASGDFNADALMKAAPDLRYVFLEVPQFTNDKDNKIDGCTVYFRYPNGTRPEDNWTCTGMRHRGQGTSSNLYGYSGRNIDLCMDRSSSLFTWIDAEGNTVESSTITLTDTSYPTDYLNIKVNIASSENANNAEMARRFNEYQPFLRYARKKDSRIKDTMEFYNCVVFIRETSTDESVPHREFKDTNWHFYGIGNVGDSKKTDDTRVNDKNDPREHIIEITDADKPLSAFPTGKEGHAVCPVDEWKTGNTAYDVLYSSEYVYDEEGAFESFGGETYEFRYEMEDITDEQRQANIDAWRELYTFIVTSSDEEFYANLKNYFVVDTALYFYLFTERYTMVDNRAKNSFWHYGKVYITETEAAELGETEASYYIIDNDAAAINDGYRYDLTQGYDFDTALGIDNTGDYVFSYGKEDTDYYVDGDPTSDYVFRVADSVFFCRLRDLFPSELQAMFKDREEKNAWNSNSLITQWDNAQAQFPEELWRLDYERKYYRTYLGLSIDNSINEGEGRGVDKSFLIGKFFGRKKYARRAFETNQEIYFATKYFGNKALSDVFWIRGNVPIGSSIAPNYSLTLVPYSNMYVCVQYTSTGTPIHKKVKAGETCYFESTADRMDFIYVYAASYIQEVGDLSKCYVGDNNFSSAIRLQKLVIGSTDEGYENTFMKEVLVANNPLLEYLDLRNISGINTIINVSGCSNLKELYAEGTNATGVIFANGGLLQTAHLPSITSLSMKNLNYITDFTVDSYDNLQTLIVENTPNINTYNMVINAPLLRFVRLININWDSTYQLEDASVFDRLLNIDGIDSSGYETELAVLTGYAFVAVMRQQQSYVFNESWTDLTIEYNSMIEQVTVTHINDNGEVLHVQYVDKGAKPYDPLTKGLIETPTKASTISTDYTFVGWDSELVEVFSDKIITATYSESLRSYTVKYESKGTVLQTTTAKYGSMVMYEGSIPTYTSEETAFRYYLFTGWDKSGLVDGDKVINAVYDDCLYADGYFDGKGLTDLRPVEIYALKQLEARGTLSVGNVLTVGEDMQITLGHDYNYDDVEAVEIIGEKTSFTGSNHIDTEITLFDEDRDFTLAIDYKFLTGTTVGSVIAECYLPSITSGFRLSYTNSKATMAWGSSSSALANINEREMVIIRHVKGEKNLYVYSSNLAGSAVSAIEIANNDTTFGTAHLVLGAANPEAGYYENKAVGEINWCKLWYADLGDESCKKLAAWTHEELTLEMCGTRSYYLSDGSGKRCSFSVLATHLLDRTKTMSSSSKNTGGWASTTLRTFLNTRLYDAIPDDWKQLIKEVQIPSSVGGGSTSTPSTGISTSACHIYIPSYVEVMPNLTSAPYINEGSTISYMTTDATRIRAHANGEANGYWLRSPNANYDSYFYTVEKSGQCSGFNNTSDIHGVLIGFSF